MACKSTRTIFYTQTILIFVVLTLVVRAHTQQSRGIVAELYDDFYEEALVDYDHAMVLFYTPKCSHCMEFLPVFKMAADELIRNEPPVHAAMVDCKAGGKMVCQEEDISRLPTVKIFRRATLYDEYDGQRTVEGLVTYLRRLVGITSTELSLDNVASFVDSQKEVAVVAVLREKGNLRENYFALPAELSKDIRFGHVTIASDEKNKMAAWYGVTLYYPKHMRSKFEPWEYKYDTNKEGYNLLEFILSTRHGMVGLRTPRHVDDFAPPLVIIYFRFDINLNAKMFSYWRNRVLKVAQNYQEFLNFAISPIDDFQNEFSKFGVTPPSEDMIDTPLVFVILQDNSKYLMEVDFSVENFDMFLGSVLNGTAYPHLKSQPIPEKLTEIGMVQNVVARNFRSVVLSREKDVLLEFYAPWCTYCKELHGGLEELATNLPNEDIVIMRMDATENEIPQNFEAPRFPTFYYIPKTPDEAPPILFAGSNSVTLHDLINFILENATFNFEAYGTQKDEL